MFVSSAGTRKEDREQSARLACVVAFVSCAGPVEDVAPPPQAVNAATQPPRSGEVRLDVFAEGRALRSEVDDPLQINRVTLSAGDPFDERQWSRLTRLEHSRL